MYDHDQMASGSYREGFRVKSSDIDIMSWSTTHEVVCDLSQISLTNPQHWSSSISVLQNPISFCILCIEKMTHIMCQAKHTTSIVCTIFSEPLVSPVYLPNMDLVGISSWMNWKGTSLIASSQTSGQIKLDHG